mgnify:CR=1 FL=1
MKLKFEFKSLRDMSYNHALVDDCLKAHAQFAIDNIEGFPESLPPEARAELVDGAMLRHNEMYPLVEYGVVDGNYLPMYFVAGTNGSLLVSGIGMPTNIYNIQFSPFIPSTNWQTIGTAQG